MSRLQGIAAALGFFLLASPPGAFGYKARSPVGAGVLPVVLKATKVPALLGANAHKLSAFRCREGASQPILFQVDEFNAEGRVVSLDSQGLSPDPSPGVLDENDEIVFMLRDTGEPCAGEILSRVPGKIVELRASAPYLEDPGVLYFVVGERGFVPAGGYVRYDRESDFTDSAALRMGYFRNQPVLLDRLAFKDVKAWKGEDVLDREKARFRVKALGSLLTITITEEDYKSSLRSARAGPIRVIRELDADVKPVPGLTLKAIVTYYHYERLWYGDVRFEIPKSAALLTSSMDMIATLDFHDQAGIRIYTGALPEGVLVDGKMLEKEKSLALGKDPWYFAVGDGHYLLGMIDLDPEFDVVPRARFIDTTGIPSPPEEVPGGQPEAGYEFLGWQNLKARWYHFTINVAVFPGFPEGGANAAYKILRVPPETSASTVETK